MDLYILDKQHRPRSLNTRLMKMSHFDFEIESVMTTKLGGCWAIWVYSTFFTRPLRQVSNHLVDPLPAKKILAALVCTMPYLFSKSTR